MKLEKTAAIAEIVSSIAIVVTLAYLAVQTQQNTAAIRGTVRQAMLSEDRESLYKMIEYPFLSGDEEYSTLTREQSIQRRAYLTAFLRMRENHWLQFQGGVLDEQTWNSYFRPLRGVVFSNETGRQLWSEAVGNDSYDPGFRDVVNELIAVEGTQGTDCGSVALEC